MPKKRCEQRLLAVKVILRGPKRTKILTSAGRGFVNFMNVRGDPVSKRVDSWKSGKRTAMELLTMLGMDVTDDSVDGLVTLLHLMQGI